MKSSHGSLAIPGADTVFTSPKRALSNIGVKLPVQCPDWWAGGKYQQNVIVWMNICRCVTVAIGAMEEAVKLVTPHTGDATYNCWFRQRQDCHAEASPAPQATPPSPA